jgi:hypothetical protein
MQIVSTIRNSQRLRNLFSSISALELLSLPETRFAYSLIMLERFVVVKKALQQTVASQQWKRYKSKQCVPEIFCVESDSSRDGKVASLWCARC